MIVPRIIFNPAIFFISILSISCESNHLLKEIKKLDHYPSASAIEYFDGKLYVMGDDANHLLILDSNLNIIDSLSLFKYDSKRIPKNVKPDLESMTIIYAGKESQLLMVGSGSLAPWRNNSYMVHQRSLQFDSIRIDSFMATLSGLGVKETNIEGMCSIPQGIVLANRGNLGYPTNYLILTSWSAISGRQLSRISLIRMGGNTDTSEFKGVSGLCYARRSDRLIMTVSTENTRNALDDGTIGKSYLWIVRNITSKRNWKAINPDDVIDLEEVDARFRGQKIESVCILKETRDFLHLVLAADNDDGSSTLFKLVVEK